MNETRELSRFVVQTHFEDLPNEVVEAARIYILDNLACGLVGASTQWAQIVGDFLRASTHGPCTIFGRDWTLSASGAALLNGVSIGGFEVDHPYSPGSCHPSGAVFPALMAATELEDMDGEAFLASVALSYEALCRVGQAATRAVAEERGFHGPGTNGPIGAAFGVGRALRFSEETMVHAIGIAVDHGAGLLEFAKEGAMTKRLHLGRGAQLGLESALLAQAGITGPSTGLEGPSGFLNVYSPSPKIERLVEDLGQRYHMLEVTLKEFPCHITCHPAVAAVSRFRAAEDFSPADVERVHIVSRHRMLEPRHLDGAPTTMMGAQYSLPFSVAMALCKDDARDPGYWTEDALKDAEITRIAGLFTSEEAEATQPGALGDIHLRIAGRDLTLAATDWKGSTEDPCTFDDVVKRFHTYAQGVIADSTIDEVVERVHHLESETSVSSLVCLMRTASPA